MVPAANAGTCLLYYILLLQPFVPLSPPLNSPPGYYIVTFFKLIFGPPVELEMVN